MKLKYHEYYSQLPVPERLKDHIYDNDSNSANHITNLSRVNVFVGQNNSGKSLLLREIIKEEVLPAFLTQKRLKEANQVILNSKKDLISWINHRGWVEVGQDSTCLINDKILDHYFTKVAYLEGNLDERADSIIATLNSYTKQPFRIAKLNGLNSTHLSKSENQDITNKIKEVQNSFKESIKPFRLPKTNTRVYCPTIRSLRKYPNENWLGDKTKKEYDFKDSVNIENGQNLYEAILAIMRDDHSIRAQKIEFQNFLSEHFFQNKSVEITPHDKKDELTIKIGSEAERPIYDLGDGIQMVIALTFPLFVYDCGIILVEEPEIFMHPGMQKKFMDVLMGHPRSDNFLFLFSTHSNHILDVANYSNEMSIYTVQKFFGSSGLAEQEANFIVTNISSDDDSALKLLGVYNTSVYLANSTIWVEGITDMLYLKKYVLEYLNNPKLKSKYRECKEYQEGIHYTFILSGGDNIVHYNFSDKPLMEELKSKVVVKKLCGRAFVIVDDDGKKNKIRKATFFRELGGRFKVLPCMEVENLLSDDAIIETIKSYPTCKNVIIPSSNQLETKAKKSVRIGTYIEKHLLKGDKTKNRKKFVSSDQVKKGQSQTVNSKLEFCNKALPHITYGNMTADAQKVVEDILDFVMEHNPK